MATTSVLVPSIFADAENRATMSDFSMRIVSKPTPAKESLLKKLKIYKKYIGYVWVISFRFYEEKNNSEVI